MISKLAIVTILVRDQDEALAFYTEKLGLEKRADEIFGPGVRWLTVAPQDQTEIEIVLQGPEPAMHGEEQSRELLQQVGQGTVWSFSTDDCRATYQMLQSRGASFLQPPQDRSYGTEAIFEDLYGNRFSLLQPS